MIAALVAALFLAGCASSDEADADPDVDGVEEQDESSVDASAADEDGEARTEATDGETSDSADGEDNGGDTAQPAVPAEFQPDAEPLTAEFSPFEPGTHRVDALGRPFSFTSVDNLFVQPNSPDLVAVTDPASRGPGDREVKLLRASGFADPAALDSDFGSYVTDWPSTDLEGWVALLPDGVVASDPEAATVGGLEAVRVELEVAEDASCGADPSGCIPFTRTYGSNYTYLDKGFRYEISVAEQAEGLPILVLVAAAPEDFEEWAATADELLATLAFGPPTRGRTLPVPAERTELPVFGGLSMEAPRPMSLGLTAPTHGVLHHELIAASEFLTSPTTTDGETLATVDELVDWLSSFGAQLTELEPADVNGVAARVFDFELQGRNAAPQLYRFEGDPRGWFPPPMARMWMMEHPERGLLLATAEGFPEFAVDYDEAIALMESLLGTAEFTG